MKSNKSKMMNMSMEKNEKWFEAIWNGRFFIPISWEGWLSILVYFLILTGFSYMTIAGLARINGVSDYFTYSFTIPFEILINLVLQAVFLFYALLPRIEARTEGKLKLS